MRTLLLLVITAIVASASTSHYKTQPLGEYRIYAPKHDRSLLFDQNKRSFTILNKNKAYVHVLASQRAVRSLRRKWKVETVKRHQDSQRTNEEIHTALVELNARYPSQTKLESIGKSVNGNDIWCIEITGTEPDDPVDKKQKPYVLFVANLNGTDNLGREMLVEFAKRLVSRADYDDDERVRDILRAAHIHIIPAVNPDGFDLGTSGNANGVNLESNFVSQNSEVETQHIIDLVNTHNYVLSASFKSGDIILYPYMDCPTCSDGDHRYNEAPDDSMFKYISNEYATRNPKMTEQILGHKTTENGANWAPVTDSFSDWMYRKSDCMDISIGLTDSNQTPPQLLDDNEESLLNFIETAYRGVRGTVRTADGTFMKDVALTLIGNTHITKTSVSGEFFRVLLPGEYTLRADAQGYLPVEKTLTVPPATATPAYVSVFFILTPSSNSPVSPTTANPNFPHVTEPCGTNLRAMIDNAGLKHEIQTYGEELTTCVTSQRQEIITQALAGKTNVSLSCTDNKKRFESACESANGHYCNAFAHVQSTNVLLPITAYVRTHFCLPPSCFKPSNVAAIQMYINTMDTFQNQCPESFNCEILLSCAQTGTPTSGGVPPTTVQPVAFSSPAVSTTVSPTATLEPSSQIVPTAVYSGRQIFIFTTSFIAVILIAIIVAVAVAYKMSERFRNFMKNTVGIGGDDTEIDFEEYDIVPLNEDENVPLED